MPTKNKTFIIDPETMRMLQEMAQTDMRTQSAQLRWLVRREYDERNTLMKQLLKVFETASAVGEDQQAEDIAEEVERRR